jgi:hypothetical protein
MVASSAMLSPYSSVFRRLSKSAWTPALTSLRRICSAPLTASAATCSRRASRLAPIAARLRPGSSNNLVAFFRGAGLGFFDDGLGTTVGVRKTRGRSLLRLGQFLLRRAGWQRRVRSWHVSAAARPSAIFWARSSNALAIGGHTNFIVNHTSIEKDDGLNEQGRVDTHGNTFLRDGVDGNYFWPGT